MNDSGASIFSEPRLYMDMIIMYLYTTIYALLFDVCAKLYCPFGPRDFDIKHDVVGKGIRHLAVSLSGGHLPPTIDNKDNLIEAPGSMLAEAELNLRRRVKGSNSRNTLRNQCSVDTKVERAKVRHTIREIGNGRVSFLPSSHKTGRGSFLPSFGQG